MLDDLKQKNKACVKDTPEWQQWKNNTPLNDKRLHSGASLRCCCRQICVCVMPRAGRCQTSLRLWNAGLFGETGPSFMRCFSLSH